MFYITFLEFNIMVYNFIRTYLARHCQLKCKLNCMHEFRGFVVSPSDLQIASAGERCVTRSSCRGRACRPRSGPEEYAAVLPELLHGPVCLICQTRCRRESRGLPEERENTENSLIMKE